ncbi:MAG: hypothetical protein Q7U76_08860 [Nitrospirota bacterium]|nr:hypothetical protein [Nitrospirota bacterium]
MNMITVPFFVQMFRIGKMGLLVLVGLLFAACAGGPSDRSDAVKMADVLKGKTKQELLVCAGAPRSERTAQSLTTMVYQEEAELVELSVPGAKSSGPRDVPHRCRATVTLKDGRVTDVRYESVPAWLGAENHCDEIFARCSQ